MKDAYFTFAMLAAVVVSAAAFAVRVAVLGMPRSARVARIGGTVLVGRLLMEWIYWVIEPVVRGLAAIGVTPNMLTWASLMFGIGAGVALGFGAFGLACLLATLSTTGDVLDGELARWTKTGSNRGELLDAVVDRYTEFAFLAGFALFVRADIPQLAIVMAALAASFMISYASAQAEALQVEVPRGLMRRHERGTYLIVGAGLSSMIGSWLSGQWVMLPRDACALAAAALIALIGNGAAVLRLVRISRALGRE